MFNKHSKIKSDQIQELYFFHANKR